MLLNNVAAYLRKLDNDFELEMFVFSHSTFWKNAYSYKDHYANFFETHEAMSNSIDIFQKFAKNVEEHATTVHEYEMFQKLKDVDRDCILFNQFRSCTEPAKELAKNWKELGIKLKTARTSLKELQTIFTGFLQKMLDTVAIVDINDIKKVLRVVSSKLDVDSSCSIGDIDDSSGFFGILDKLRSPADKLQKCMKLQTFIALCSSLMPEIYLFISEAKSCDTAHVDTQLVPTEISKDNAPNTKMTSDTDLVPTELSIDSIDDAPNTKINALQVLLFTNKRCVAEYKSWLQVVTKETVTLDQIFRYSHDEINICDEIKQASELFKMPVSDQLYSALDWLNNLDQHREHVESIKNTLAVLNFTHVDMPLFKAIDTFFTCLNNRDEVTILAMEKAMNNLKGPLSVDNEEWYVVLSEFSKATELLDFLNQSVDDDFRNLIDAVEERSEQTIDESTVSNLIHVKRLIRPVLEREHKTPEDLLDCLLTALCKELKEGQGMAARIRNCSHHVHSLKALYLHVANRGELTKEIISNAMTNGSYKWVVNEDTSSCLVSLSYEVSKDNKSQQYVYDAEQLNDLRSRALLISNSNRQEIEDEKKEKDDQNYMHLKDFVEIVDIVIEISLTLEELHNLGHFDYNKFDEKIASSTEVFTAMQGFLNSKLIELADWKRLLQKCRQKFVSLNFLYSDQLLLFSRFLSNTEMSNEDHNHLKDILQFVHPGATLEGIDLIKSTSNLDSDNIGAKLEQIGCVVDKLMQRSLCARRLFPDNIKFQKQAEDINAIVQPGVLYIVHLEMSSTQTIPVLLSLYANTSQHFPVPSEVLFCHDLTTSEEIHLLIERSIKSVDGNLHCICNVERLPNVLQYQLVDELGIILSNTGYENRLAIICRGGQHHPIIDYFTSYVHRLQGFDGPTMENCLRNVWKDVCLVTSAVPGLGKTEYVKTLAAEGGCKTKSVHVSGPISRESLVSRLRTINPRKTCALHLDIAEVDDANFLDACLFEFIALGCLCSRTKVVCHPMSLIFLEIANSVQNRLRDSLVVLSCFNRVHLVWQNYENFIISRHICSPVQIVCQYLKRLDDGTLDQSDVSLTSQLKLISEAQCKKLLSHYFSSAADLSFSVMNIFLNVFGEQLRKLSGSQYFTVNNLKAMLGNSPKSVIDVRSKLVLALLDVAKEFACRSVQSCRSLQTSTQIAVTSGQLDEFLKGKATTAEIMTNRLADMLHWEDTNHLLVSFNSIDSQTVSALYKDLKKVPLKINELFTLQLRQLALPDFTKYQQADLQGILDKLAKTSMQKNDIITDNSYALTHDNLLKMVLILLRIRANVPVIIMGETGCGKTSLVRHLAVTCNIHFKQFSIHAGIAAKEIVDEIDQINDICMKKPKQQVWLFLDEINTCEHMGLLTDIICHRTCFGNRIADNCKFVAACNPYRLRQDEEICTAGLDGKVKKHQYSKLVYRVHSLPETMIDYVWDYGTLHKTDECAYIKQMVNKTVQDVIPLQMLQEKIVKVMIKSQEFTRKIQ